MHQWQDTVQVVFREIRRRRMLGTCAVYIVLCWGLLQAARTLVPVLGAEWDAYPGTALVVSLAGLPLIVIFAWFYQLTRGGIVKVKPFSERRVLANIAPLEDRRHRPLLGREDKIEYDWLLFAMSGPLRGLTYPIVKTLVLGRSIDCDVTVMSSQMSRHHASLAVEQGVLSVEDLGSANGTMVNGERIEGVQELHHTDVLKFQEIELQVRESLSRARGEHASMCEDTVLDTHGSEKADG